MQTFFMSLGEKASDKTNALQKGMTQLGLLVIALFFSLSQLQAQIQIGADIDGAVATDESGRSVSLSSDGSTVAIGASNHDGKKGYVRVYKNESGSWTQVGDDIGGAEAGDQSGISVSLSSDGSTVAISAPFHDGVKGHVRVYKNESGTWAQVGADIDGAEANDYSGWSISLSSDGSTVAIGAPYHDGWKGYVRVYKNESGSWTQVGDDIDGAEKYDESGISVSLSSDGSTVAIGAYGHDGYKGHVRVYKNESGSWTQVAADIDGAEADDKSGISVSLSSDGSTVAIGAPNHDGGKGHVRVHKNEGGTWTQVGADIDGAEAGDQSGVSVSLSSDGNTVAIGANGHDGAKGQVRVYKNESGSWTQVGADIDGAEVDDQSGGSVSLSSDGSTLAIGAPHHDEAKGQVRVYQLPQQAKEFEPLSLSGFNHDVIAEGFGNKAVDVTTTTFDNPATSGSDHVFYNKEFKYGATGGKYGLPDDGKIKSASNELIAYQLQAYDKNNVLLLTDDEEGELVLEKASVFSRLSILSASAQGASEFTVTVTYSDNTTETKDFTVADWFDGDNPAIQGFGRITRTNDDYEESDINPRLYDSELEVNPNKVVTKLKFSKKNSTSRTGIFAVCGAIVQGTPETPVALAATDVVASTSFVANWEKIDEADAYYLDVATDENFTKLLDGFNNQEVGDVSNITINTTEPIVYYRVRAHNKVGQSNSSNTIVVDVALSSSIPQQLGVTLYPNPANNVLNVSSENGAIESLVIRDITGKVVFQSQTSFQNASFNIADLKPGMYNISFVKEGQQINTKLMKH